MGIEIGSIGDVTGVMMCVFGDGNLRVINGSNREEGNKTIMMRNATEEEKELGLLSKSYENSTDFRPEVAIVFRSRESFNLFCGIVNMIDNEYILEEIEKLKSNERPDSEE